jgi:hypothetical protein
MVALALREENSLWHQPDHRFTPAAKRAKGVARAGRCGEFEHDHMFMWINNPNENLAAFSHAGAASALDRRDALSSPATVKKVHAFMKRGQRAQGWSNAHINMLFESGVIGHLMGSYDGGGPGHQWGLERCEIVGQDARIVITDACEVLEFQPRGKIESETYKYLGNMRSFGDTFRQPHPPPG